MTDNSRSSTTTTCSSESTAARAPQRRARRRIHPHRKRGDHRDHCRPVAPPPNEPRAPDSPTMTTGQCDKSSVNRSETIREVRYQKNAGCNTRVRLDRNRTSARGAEHRIHHLRLAALAVAVVSEANQRAGAPFVVARTHVGETGSPSCRWRRARRCSMRSWRLSSQSIA